MIYACSLENSSKRGLLKASEKEAMLIFLKAFSKYFYYKSSEVREKISKLHKSTAPQKLTDNYAE